jgi:hypothetical protein
VHHPHLYLLFKSVDIENSYVFLYFDLFLSIFPGTLPFLFYVMMILDWMHLWSSQSTMLQLSYLLLLEQNVLPHIQKLPYHLHLHVRGPALFSNQ